jgi:hypothetical protein
MKSKTGVLKIGIIFTLDYEIHGNGSGEFENWAYLPTSHMLDVLDRYGARLTIMAEMGHYWAMKRYGQLFSSDILLFEQQLKDAVSRGHDVQMHYHPQWIDARYENGTWKLDFSRATIERLCYNYEEALFYLKKGKSELESLLKPVRPDYQCICFRSGFLQMQPSENMLNALSDAGFISESSVSKGMKANDALRVLDFTAAFSHYYPWKAALNDINSFDKDGKIFEFPLLSYPVRFTDKIIGKLSKLRKGKSIKDVISGFMAGYGKGMMPVNAPVSVTEKIKNAVKLSWDYVDFCQRSHDEMLRYIKMVIRDSKRTNKQGLVPVVLIGHSKDFFFANNLVSFVEKCAKLKCVEFINYRDAAIKFKSENEE